MSTPRRMDGGLTAAPARAGAEVEGTALRIGLSRFRRTARTRCVKTWPATAPRSRRWTSSLAASSPAHRCRRAALRCHLRLHLRPRRHAGLARDDLKQNPWAQSIRLPSLRRCPNQAVRRRLSLPFGVADMSFRTVPCREGLRCFPR